MARRWRNASGFRADPAPPDRSRPSRVQATALLAGLVLVAGSVAAASYLVEPDRARSFDVFHGSVFLNDSVAPVAIDLATGLPTIRLISANAQVGASSMADLSVVPLDDGTLLLNRSTGEFNMVDSTGFMIQQGNTGVRLPEASGSASTAFGVADGQMAYIVRSGSTGASVYLVSKATVQSAASAGGTSKPRASFALDAPVSGHGTAGSANGHLWLLLGTGSTRTITELSVPNGSAPGAVLNRTNHDTVDYGTDTSPTAAIATATNSSTDSRETVGVASPGQVQVFGADGSLSRVPYTSPDGLDAILPATGGVGRLSYLLHGDGGWSLLSVRTDGNGTGAPIHVGAIAPGDELIAPVVSEGALYTMSTTTGDLQRISDRGDETSASKSVPTYPLGTVNGKADGKIVETATFSDAYAIAQGSRVIFNSPSHNNAVVLFTEPGNVKTLTVRKSEAVEVSAVSGVDGLIGGRILQPPVQKKSPTPKTVGPPQNRTSVNAQIDCASTSQKPHLPIIGLVTKGSRSVSLSWSYPTLDRQDCVPSTYVVSVSLADGTGRTPPGPQTVQGQNSYVFSGLQPSTDYKVNVTAELNGSSANSTSVAFTTTPEGPTAATDVTAQVAADGSWTVRWSSCGTAGNDCVPSEGWLVTSQFCDGIGLSNAPAPVTVFGDTSSTVQPGARVVASDALLGRALRFQVQGRSANGLAGAVSARSACVQSWRAPIAAALKLSASVPTAAGVGQAVPVSATLDLGSTPVRAAGGTGATVTFTLTGKGQTQSSGPVAYAGASSRVTASFGSVSPGYPYSVSATVAPPGHASAAVTVGSVAVSTASAWPAPVITATCDSSLLTCELSVQIANVSSAAANGELFTLDNASQIRCGNAAAPLDHTAFDPSTTAVTATLSQLSGYYGTCTVTVALNESTTSANPYYGKLTSPTATVQVDLGASAVAALGPGDLTADWDSANGSQVSVDYTGSAWTTTQLAQLTSGWAETVVAPNGTACGTSTDSSAPSAVTVDSSCVDDYGDQSGWQVNVSYTNQVDGTPGGSFSYSLNGGPPSYQPCTPNLSAAWGATVDAGVSVSNDGSAASVSGCSDWSYELRDPSDTSCGTTGDNTPPAQIAVTCPTPLVPGTWQVIINYKNTAGDSQPPITLTVPGDPPTA